MRYSVAADGGKWIDSHAVNEGPDRSSWVPTGNLHAVDEGVDETMCERPVRFPFADLDFEQLSGNMTPSKCPDCVAAVGAATQPGQAAAPPGG